ncbi:MAG: hypothetical protein SAK29_33330 [Scytonema sp. PMC 1069.18]|nr:hypothetical protein [Scytonema sp. PMC 1069.18]MEC4880601.1 hypothetical protein [Scytonema sp. PMC 1070.18]
MNDFCNLLQNIKDNPVFYLGKPSITCLYSFLVGYLSTLSLLGFSHAGSVTEGFQEWIQERENTKLTRSWAGILLFVCGSETKAFYAFFELFQNFFKEKEKILEKENNLTYNSDNVFNSNIYDLYELLKSLKKRPGIFLGTDPSITKLDMYLRGYSLAKREVGLPPTEQEQNFEEFQSWVQERYGIKSNQSWAKIIIFYSTDEQESLERFFELFEEYLNQNKSQNQVIQLRV